MKNHLHYLHTYLFVSVKNYDYLKNIWIKDFLIICRDVVIIEWIVKCITHINLQVINEMFKAVMTEDKVFEMVSKSQEFDQIKVSAKKI